MGSASAEHPEGGSCTKHSPNFWTFTMRYIPTTFIVVRQIWIWMALEKTCDLAGRLDPLCLLWQREIGPCRFTLSVVLTLVRASYFWYLAAHTSRTNATCRSID